MNDVISGICEKLERRHPHALERTKATTPDEVNQRWARIETSENQSCKQGASVNASTSILDGVPKSLPTLARAQKLGEKAASVGFDWPDWTGCRAKINEELGELDQALANQDTAAATEELGDVLFTVVNLARHIGVDAELALRATIRKFMRRFAAVERETTARHGGFSRSSSGNGAVDLDTLEEYWQEAKRREIDCKLAKK